jgi:hypothetical protein
VPICKAGSLCNTSHGELRCEIHNHPRRRADLERNTALCRWECRVNAESSCVNLAP